MYELGFGVNWAPEKPYLQNPHVRVRIETISLFAFVVNILYPLLNTSSSSSSSNEEAFWGFWHFRIIPSVDKFFYSINKFDGTVKGIEHFMGKLTKQCSKPQTFQNRRFRTQIYFLFWLNCKLESMYFLLVSNHNVPS